MLKLLSKTRFPFKNQEKEKLPKPLPPSPTPTPISPPILTLHFLHDYSGLFSSSRSLTIFNAATSIPLYTVTLTPTQTIIFSHPPPTPSNPSPSPVPYAQATYHGLHGRRAEIHFHPDGHLMPFAPTGGLAKKFSLTLTDGRILYWRKDSGLGWRLACEDEYGGWVGRYDGSATLGGKGGVKGGLMEVREDFWGVVGEVVIAGMVVAEVLRKQRMD
ncbi:MAG: hypothetical protein L6R41_004907 [Letrouitia leprolyta]|nr:MAG: hypothetical protein L6R41_004907 [Letrouitia leprolyta]